MMKNSITIQQLKKDIKKFVKERNWEQFHSPKNLSMSLSIEAAVKVLKDKRERSEVEDEVADIAIYLIDFCNLYNVDLEKAIIKKMKKNVKKYPAKRVKGKSEKYTFYKRQR